VVSGHFSGSFHGQSGLNLTTNELESYSCNPKCDGILNNPKEVYLFGCNTLAGKSSGRQSLESLMSDLMNTGFDRVQASNVIVFLRSEFGRMMKNRMQDIFPKTPQIYGFSRVSPTGPQIEPLIKNYLSRSKIRYKNFHQAAKSTDRNEQLFSSLTKTTLTQTKGSNPNLKNVEDKPYCYMQSQRVRDEDKIQYIENLFIDKKAMPLLAHIQTTIKEIESRRKALAASALGALEHLRRNETVRLELMRFLTLKGDAYITFKAQVINSLIDLGMIDPLTAKSAFDSLLDLSTPFTQTRSELLCRANLRIEIPYELIPEARWQDDQFMNSLGCLKPSDHRIYQRIANMIPDMSLPALRRATATALLWSGKITDVIIQQRMIDALRTEKEINNRNLLARALRDAGVTRPQLLEQIREIRSSETDPNVLGVLMKINR
jgi:hypothetical protein